jgi:hypothetical protein
MQIYTLIAGMIALEVLPWLILAVLVAAAIYVKRNWYP